MNLCLALKQWSFFCLLMEQFSRETIYYTIVYENDCRNAIIILFVCVCAIWRCMRNFLGSGYVWHCKSTALLSANTYIRKRTRVSIDWVHLAHQLLYSSMSSWYHYYSIWTLVQSIGSHLYKLLHVMVYVEFSCYTLLIYSASQC